MRDVTKAEREERERQKREEESRRKEIQLICENDPSLRELQAKLTQAYINKERGTQLVEKEQIKLQKKQEEVVLAAALEEMRVHGSVKEQEAAEGSCQGWWLATQKTRATECVWLRTGFDHWGHRGLPVTHRLSPAGSLAIPQTWLPPSMSATPRGGRPTSGPVQTPTSERPQCVQPGQGCTQGSIRIRGHCALAAPGRQNLMPTLLQH